MNKRKALLITAVAILYCLIGQPFIFTDVRFGGRLFSIKFVLLILLLVIGFSSSKYSKKHGQVWGMCALYALLALIFHIDCYPGVLLFFFDASFFFCIFSLAYKDPVFREIIYKADIYFSIFIGVTILACYFAFQSVPGIFLSIDIGDYPVFYHWFLGTVSAWGGRVVGYFNEPSYTGFYIGIHFFLLIGAEFVKFRWRILILILFLADLLVVLSLGAFIYMSMSLIVLFVAKVLRINSRLIKTGIFAGLLFAIFILPSFNVYNMSQDIVEIESTSTDDRQYRMVLGDKVVNDMTMIDLFVGKGIDSVAKIYKIGLSDAYRKLYVEYGLLFLLFFMWFLNKMLGKNLPGYCYILLSCLSIIIVTTPIALLAYLSFYTQSSLKQIKE